MNTNSEYKKVIQQAPIEKGAWPFITYKCFQEAKQWKEWTSRHHRKGFLQKKDSVKKAAPIWKTHRYNWVMGLFFAIGSTLFALGCLFSLFPSLVKDLAASTTNITFFAGSIPFTTAGYLQLFQAANANRDKKPLLIGWLPKQAGWLSSFLQFLGTIAFNFNTYDALIVNSGRTLENLSIWLPGMIGSVLFLVSAYIAYVESTHSHFAKPKLNIEYAIVAINLLGCIAFMISSTLAYVPKYTENMWIITTSTTTLLVGSVCFFVGAVLSMKE